MEKHTIRKSIAINSPQERVWDVMLSDKFTRIWYGEFCEGSHAETDWKVGSKALFKDNSESGLVGMVIANKPYEVVSVEYKGIILEGIEDYKSEGANNVKGGLETYRLTEKNGVTHLSIECDMSEEYFETMSTAWERALQKIKGLSEKNMDQKIQLKHPAGKKNVRIGKSEHIIIQKAILKSIKEKGELTHTEISECVAKELKRNKIKFKNSIGWYVESVKLDMEADKIIEKIPRTSPQKYSIIK